MTSINEHMTTDHRQVDALYEAAERAARAGELTALTRSAEEFLRRIAAHIAVEDDLLFPAFEEHTGMGEGGPTATMRLEHRDLEALFQQMRAALSSQDAAGYLRASAPMMDLLVQHNQKEEQMMYPMLDEALGGDVGPLLSAVRAALPLA